MTKEFSKPQLVGKLLTIKNMGWVQNARPGNVGGVGNTLEDLLEIEENNLQIPDAGEWEIKCQRDDTQSLTTLFHMEPYPRKFRFVPRILLPYYGWPHKEAGKKYPSGEMSFRQTIHARMVSDRGFSVVVNWAESQLEVSFDATKVDSRHSTWLKKVEDKIGLNDLSPRPHWGFDKIVNKASDKLKNILYIKAEVQRDEGTEYFAYSNIKFLHKLNLIRFIRGIEQGFLLIDFDARTGHNHGTKFRIRQDKLPEFYEDVEEVA